MPASPFTYSPYYAPPPQQHTYSSLSYTDHYPDTIPLTHQDHHMSNHQDHSMSHSMQPPPSPSIPIDPALALYPPYYSYQQPQPHLPQHLSLPPNYSSPSSQGSDTIGTPPTEHMSYSSSNANGKRPASSLTNGSTDSRKKARKGDESEPQSPIADKEETKAKPTRGSRLVQALSSSTAI